MKIQDVMTRNPRCVTPDTPAREAARIMKDENVGIVPVVDSSSRRLVGLVTDRDLAVRIVADGRDSNSLVRNVMSSGDLSTVGLDQDVDSAMDLMSTEQVRRIPVVDERGSLVGIVAQADIVRKSRDEHKSHETIEHISRPGGQHAQ